MKTAAVIAEFNPFHNGHALIAEKAREAGADRVIALMSGDFVQRGIPAVTGRRVRAHMALLGGFDAVLAYPTRFATSSAESFASHAVQLLNALGCVDILVFGSECGDIDRMRSCAKVLVEEPPAFRESLLAGLRSGLSFPKARAAALPEYADILASPNNILAIEYLKAILRHAPNLAAYTVRREGAGYLDDAQLTKLSSAAAVRRALARGTNFPGLEISVPPACLSVLKEDIGVYGVTTENDYSLLLADRLWKVGEPYLLERFADVSPDLANTIYNKRSFLRRIDEFAEICGAKNYTRTRIYRAFLHIILDIRKDAALDSTQMTQVLGFRKESTDVISAIQENARIPVIMNPPAGIAGLLENEKRLFDEERAVSNLYETVRAQRIGKAAGDMLREPVIKV